MPRLQEFVGTREYPPKPPLNAGSSAMHPNSKNERMRAIIHGLASSTDPQKTKSVYGSSDDAFSGRQPNRDENGISSSVLGVPDAPSGSSITNTRWHGYRPIVRASYTRNDPPLQDPDPMEGTSLGNDIFGTDIENFDSTVASSDVASSDSSDIQSRHREEDIGRGASTNPNQLFGIGQLQQGSILLKSEYHEYQNDEYTVPLDKEDILRDIAGKDRKNIADENSNDQRLDEIDRLARNSDPRVLEGHPGRPFQRLPHATNIRVKSTPTIATAPKLVSGRNSMESSTGTFNSGLTNRRDIAFHASNGESGAKSLHAGEPRREEVKDIRGNRHNHISSDAELNHTRSRQDRGDIRKDAPLQAGSSFASRSENSKRTEDLDHGSTHLGGTINQQTREEPFEQNLEDGPTNNLQTIAETEISKTLLELYDTRGNTDAHSQREAFFSALDITQSERCGDYFIERFVDIVAKYNAVRRQRRDMATALEVEIAGREAHVGTRREVVDRNLNELRQAGKGVVRGKTSVISSE